MTLDTQIKGFKHLKSGAECAIVITERFGRGRYYTLRTIRSFDILSGVIELEGTARTFGMNGYELGHTGGEPRQRLIVPVPDEVRTEIWKREAKRRIETLLLNWKNVDLGLVQAIIEAIDLWYEQRSKK